MDVRTVEYVVVGGGTTGCVVAARLAQAGASVAVVEAGYHVVGDERVDIPGNFGQTLGDPEFDWCFETVPQSGLDGRKVPLPRGKTLGGTSVINSMTWGRASKAEYDDISKTFANGKDWRWDDLLPYFKAVETLVPPESREWALEHGATFEPSFHGTSGPLRRGFVPFLGDSHVPFFKALNNLGVPTNPDSCNGNNLGVFSLATAIDPSTAKRSSSAAAFYVPNKEKIILIDGAQARRIIFKSGSPGLELVASGVEYQRNGQVEAIYASREVIISAGAYETPKLLEVSGIGDKRHLQRIGVQALVDLPGVGENLQDHLLVPTSFEMTPGIITGQDLLDPEYAAKEMELYKKTGQGQYASVHSAFSLLPLEQATSPHRSKEILAIAHRDSPPPDARLAAGTKAVYDMQDRWFKDPKHGQLEFMHVPQFCCIATDEPKPNTPYLSILCLAMHAYSRGRVHARSSNPLQPPLIDPSYLSNKADLLMLMDAVRYALRLAKTQPLSKMIVGESIPSAKVATDDVALTEYIKKSMETAHHPMGTASMMPREFGGVVNPKLKVYGTTNLRIADASIIPIQLSAHPQATLYAIGEKTAAILIQDRSWLGRLRAKL